MGTLFGGGDVPNSNSAQAAMIAAQQTEAQQRQQWQQQQVSAQQAQQQQSVQQQLQQNTTTAQNAAAAQKAKQDQIQAEQAKAAALASAPYQSSQNSTALAPLNTAASILAGASGAGSNSLPGFNTVMAKQQAAQGFLGQQNSLQSGGVKLGG